MALHTPWTIGVIDDKPAFARGLAHVLRRDGGTVDTAAYGPLALAHLQAQRSDAVLCDLRLSGLDGPDCSGILCRQHASLRQRVMFLTGDTVGADCWSIQQVCAELREGRMAIMPLVGTRAQLDATFPLALSLTPAE